VPILQFPKYPLTYLSLSLSLSLSFSIYMLYLGIAQPKLDGQLGGGVGGGVCLSLSSTRHTGLGFTSWTCHDSLALTQTHSNSLGLNQAHCIHLISFDFMLFQSVCLQLILSAFTQWHFCMYDPAGAEKTWYIYIYIYMHIYIYMYIYIYVCILFIHKYI